MIYYSTALLLYAAYMTFVCIKTREATSHFLYVLVGMLPLVLLVVLRGEVGTDTASYIDIVSQISNTGTSNAVEFGFVYLVKALLHFANNPLLVCVLIALITTVVMLIASSFDSRALFIFIVCIVPLCYLYMTMNVLRYGLSFAFAMLAISKFYQHRLILSTVLGVVAVLFHVTGVFVFFTAAILADNKFELMRWGKLITVVLLVALAQYYMGSIINYLLEVNSYGGLDAKGKYLSYKASSSPSWYSGLATLIISWAILYVLYGGKNRETLLTNQQFFALISLTLSTFLLAKFSYVGLRLQYVVLCAMLIQMQFKPNLVGVMSHTRKRDVLVIGYIGLLVFVKDIVLSQGQGLSPFLPWRFNPDIVRLWDVIHG